MTFYAEAKEPKPEAPTAVRRAYAITLIRFAPAHVLRQQGDDGGARRHLSRLRALADARGPRGEGLASATAKPTSDQTARREFVILSAAIGLHHKEFGLETMPVVTQPARKPSSRVALTREQAARLLVGALGFYRDDAGVLRGKGRFVRAHRKRTARFIIGPLT